MIDDEILKAEQEFLPNKTKSEPSKYADVHRFNMKEVDTYDRGELDPTRVTDDMPLAVRERK
jgi:hypothetical protein